MAISRYRRWEFIHKDPLGNFKRIITSLYSAKVSLKLNSPGLLVLELPSIYCESNPVNGYAASDFGEMDRIEVWYTIDGQKRLLDDTTFFVVNIQSSRDNDGKRTVVVESDSTLAITETRINPYNSEDPNSDLVDRNTSDQMKFIMRNNFSAAAASYVGNPDPMRTVLATTGLLAIQADNAYGIAWKEDIENSAVLDALQTIAEFSFGQGFPLFFDIVYLPATGTFEFQTFAAQRRTDRTVAGQAGYFAASASNRTIADYRLEFNYRDTVNRVYAAGEGTGAARPYVVVDEGGTAALQAEINANPWKLRETFTSVSSDDPADITNAGEAELQANKAVVIASGLLGETPAYRFGIDFDYGDKIVAVLEGNNLDVHISSLTLDLTGDKEELALGFTTEFTRGNLQGIGKVLQEISRLKRSIRKFETREYA